jgi:hypothetical protein
MLWLAAFLLAVPVWAQGPAPGRAKPAPPPAEPTPRWPDGHPNLGSTPEHKGYWEIRPGGNVNKFPRAADMPLQPWARALQQYRQSRTDLYPPLVLCKPGGGPSFFNSPGFEIVDVPELQRIFILNIAGPHSWREIYMDGRPHPTGPNVRPTYLGHSVGRWEGDTLVIDTVNFNEKQWIQGSYPNTEQLHMVERITRPNLRTIVYEVTVEDPGALTGSWTGSWTITSAPGGSSWIDGGEIFEYICQDDRAH